MELKFIAFIKSRYYKITSNNNIKINLNLGRDINIGPYIRLTLGQQSFIFCICHRKKERSIPFFGLEKYFCSRCLGVILGAICGVCLRILGFSISIIAMIALLLPLLLDGISQAIKIRTSNNTIRLITGYLSGIGILLGIKYGIQ